MSEVFIVLGKYAINETINNFITKSEFAKHVESMDKAFENLKKKLDKNFDEINKLPHV